MIRSILKYSLTALLSSLVALPFALHWGIYFGERELIRASVKEQFESGLESSELSKFQFSEANWNELEHEDGGREFYWLDHKYDLVKLELKNDSVWVWAWLDHRESLLKKRFTKMLNDRYPQPLPSEKELWQQLKQQWLPSAQNTALESKIETGNTNYYASLRDLFLWAESPPPRN